MKLIKLILITSPLYSCSIIENIDKECHDDIKPYLVTYINEANSRGVNPNVNEYIIKFEDNLYVGSTKAKGSAQRSKGVVIIKIDSDFWRTATESEKEVLFMHEAGHGFLDYDHYVNDIMHTNKFKYNKYITNRDSMLDEFFGL